MMDSTQNSHHNRVTSMLPAKIVGIDTLDEEGEQTSGQTNGSGRQDKSTELIGLRIIAETPHALLIVSDSLKDTAEGRMDDAPDHIHGAKNDYDDEVVILEV